MNVIYDDSTGDVLAINREVFESESNLQIDKGDLIYGIDNEFYSVVGGVFVPKDSSVVGAIISQRLADASTESSRIEQIKTAQESSGIKKYTIEQIETYLDNRFDAITDLATAKIELRKIFDKIVPYLLG